jgi:hypothetical protein
VVEIDPVARRILEYRVRCPHRRYPDQLPAVTYEGLLTAMPADIGLVGETELDSVHANPGGDRVVTLPGAVSRQP